MTEVPQVFPFTQLSIGKGETPLWIGHNPTFHRFFRYGLLISNVALYTCPGSWLFARWRKYPLRDLANVALGSPDSRPQIEFKVRDRKVHFRTPSDSYPEEVETDRRVLSGAVEFLKSQVGGTSSSHATNPSIGS